MIDETIKSPDDALAAETLKSEFEEIKRKRGRPRKNSSTPKNNLSSGAFPESAPPKPTQWNEKSARVLLISEGLIFSGLTGFDGFGYSEAQAEFLSPILSDLLNDLLPYDSSVVKILAFCCAYGGIKSYQFRAFSDFRKAAKKEHQPEKSNTPNAAAS